MTWQHYNNFGVGAIAIISILNHRDALSLTKSLLVLPFIMHKECLSFLSRKNTTPKGIAAIIATHPDLFLNFNKRYENTLTISLNSIQLLLELKLIQYNEGQISLINKIEIDASFGKRAEKIANASEKISHILNSSEEELYLNLRIKL